MGHRIVTVTEFKAKCLALLDDIGQRGDTITVTKRGLPLASVGAVKRPEWKSPEGALAGKITLANGILETDISQLWDCVCEADGA